MQPLGIIVGVYIWDDWLLIASVGWLIIFVLTLISKAWNREDKLSSGALLCDISYFILAFLLH